MNQNEVKNNLSREEIFDWYDGSVCAVCKREECWGDCPDYYEMEQKIIDEEVRTGNCAPIIPCQSQTNNFNGWMCPYCFKKECNGSCMKNEIHLTICGIKLFRLYIGIGVWRVEGSPGFVNAEDNMLKIIQYKRWLLGMYHTHPSFNNDYSFTDKDTFKAQATTFGERLFFFIDGRNGIATYKVIKNANYIETYPPVPQDLIVKISNKVLKLGRLFIWW